MSSGSGTSSGRIKDGLGLIGEEDEHFQIKAQAP